MSTTQEILVPLDGSRISEQAIAYAQALIEPGAELTLLQVLPDPEPVRGLFGDIVASVNELREMYEELAGENLSETAQRWAAIGVRSRIEVLFGDPAERIIKTAEARGAEVIVMTSHGRGALGRWVFGSVADEVARTSSIPVMIIHPRVDPADPQPDPVQIQIQVQRLVVPLDGSPLAARALPVAEGLAKRLNLPVLIVRAIDPAAMLPPPTTFGRGLAFPETAYLELSSQLEAEARSTVAAATDQLQRAGVTATWSVLTGPAFASIAEATQPGDVIVLTSHGRSGLRRWLIGSTAEKLVRSGPVPVVLVPARAPGDVESAETDVVAEASDTTVE